MSDAAQVKLLKEEGTASWNLHLERSDVRTVFHDAKVLSNPSKTDIDLSWADLRGMDLAGVDFYRANLVGANLQGTNLDGALLRLANLQGADLSACHADRADFYCANLSLAQLRDASLRESRLFEADMWEAKCSSSNFAGSTLAGADLRDAYLYRANFEGASLAEARLDRADLTFARLGHANLSKATLDGAYLHRTDLENADLSYSSLIKTTISESSITGSRVYGISAWDMDLADTSQTNLIVTPTGEPMITVDDIEVAQFIYLLLHNDKIRAAINAVTSKAVLILGRFTTERKAVLERLRLELRASNYVPILFDFEQPRGRNLTETVTTLARLARFIIADLTDPRSIPQELEAIVPRLRVPVQTIIANWQDPYSMFADFDARDYHWMLPVYRYQDVDDLLGSLQDKVIGPAEMKAAEFDRRRAEVLG